MDKKKLIKELLDISVELDQKINDDNERIMYKTLDVISMTIKFLNELHVEK